MRKILFDGCATQGFPDVKYHGGGEYAKFILRSALDRGYKFDIVFGNWLVTDDDVKILLNEHPDINVYNVDNKQQLYQLINNSNYNVFYSALAISYPDYNCKATLIGVVHGLRAAELPWDFYRYKYEPRFFYRIIGWIISHCSIIQDYLKKKHIKSSLNLMKVKDAKFITVSNHTKYSLLSFFPDLKETEINVYYSPFTVKAIGKVELKDNYYLMISGNRYEKNIYRAVKVLDKLFSEGYLADKRVIITGCSNQPFWRKIKNRNRFELRPYVSSDQLEQLYKDAFCFIYPSLNEGFGYPPLKAMAYGTPVIASSSTSIPEVCDDAACYFSPTNEDDLAVRILHIYYDDNYRKILIERGLNRVSNLLNKQASELENELKMIFC